MNNAKAEILIAGGATDPNLSTLTNRLSARQVLHETVLVGSHAHPRLSWELDSDTLLIGGKVHKPRAMFVRHDVFTALSEQRPEANFRALAWYSAVSGWALAHPEVRILNRRSALHLTNKAHVLHVARAAGLSIPSTLVTNDFRMLRASSESRIVKPVNGGDYARELSDVIVLAQPREGALAAPAIVQERLVPPEVRIYGIAGQFLAFQLVADALDYRSAPSCQVLVYPLSELETGLLERLAALMETLQMDFGAADFKMSPTTGRLCFLEINSGPMFAAFDAVSGGSVSNAIIDFLDAA